MERTNGFCFKAENHGARTCELGESCANTHLRYMTVFFCFFARQCEFANSRRGNVISLIRLKRQFYYELERIRLSTRTFTLNKILLCHKTFTPGWQRSCWLRTLPSSRNRQEASEEDQDIFVIAGTGQRKRNGANSASGRSALIVFYLET